MKMAASSEASLFVSTDSSLWRAALGCYEEVLELVTAQKKKGTKPKSESLIQLDKWFQKTLPSSIQSRKPPHLTHEELTKLMKWKLTRGKFRPRLTELVQQNSPEDVVAATQSAFAALPDLEKAVKTLTQLKAVGPATASAILCAAAPASVPFMADESVLAVPGIGRLEYTLRHFLAYAKKVQTKAKQLNKEPSDDLRWTAHDVEVALYSFHFAKKLKPDLLNTKSDACSAEKTEASSQDTDSEDSEYEKPPTKKHRK